MSKYPEAAEQKSMTAAIFWLKNRDPQHWRDVQNIEHALGKYIISDQPMSEEQWARERADVIDAEPVSLAKQHEPIEAVKNQDVVSRFGDGREEKHLEAARKLKA
jgi:hypothetical protein